MPNDADKVECDDFGNVCALIVECGGWVFSWKRLKIAAYYLSPKGKAEGRESEPLLSYRFDGSCYAGPDDSELKTDLDALTGAGYIGIRTEEVPGASEHLVYRLTESGRELGLLAQGHWTESQTRAVRALAQDLKDPTISVSSLLGKYARKWDAAYQTRPVQE
jgi:DNA-binding PadR family transcriptional regulator